MANNVNTGVGSNVSTEEKLKHLEFIQNVITRKNSNSFVIKGWTVTLISAAFALAAKDANIGYLLITFISIPVFYGLDAYYLSQERAFRSLYNAVIKSDSTVAAFSMNTKPFLKDETSWIACLRSISIWPVYLAIIIISSLIMYGFINAKI